MNENLWKHESSKIDLAIKIVGVLLILVSLLKIPLALLFPRWSPRPGIDSLVFELLLGYFIIKKAYWARIIGLFLAVGSAGACFYFATVYFTYPVPKLIYYSYFFFYSFLFLFLLFPPVKRVFGLPPYLKKIGRLTDGEIKGIRNGIRLVAFFLMLHGFLMIILSDWFTKHGFSAGDATTYFLFFIFEIIIAIGLLLKRKIVGRAFALAISLFFVGAYVAIPFLERSAVQGPVGVVTTVFIVVSFTCIFFLAHPRTKAYFHMPESPNMFMGSSNPKVSK